MPGVVQNTEQGWKDGALHQDQQLATARGEQQACTTAELWSRAATALCWSVTAGESFHRLQEKDFRRGRFWGGSCGTAEFLCSIRSIMGGSKTIRGWKADGWVMGHCGQISRGHWHLQGMRDDGKECGVGDVSEADKPKQTICAWDKQGESTYQGGGEKHPSQPSPAKQGQNPHLLHYPCHKCLPGHERPSVARVNVFFFSLAQIRLRFEFKYPAPKCVCNDKATTDTSHQFKASWASDRDTFAWNHPITENSSSTNRSLQESLPEEKIS